MSVRKPVVMVIGPGGRDLVPFWGTSLLGVTITDQAGYESDEAVLRFSAPPYEPPAKGTLYTVRVGWSRDALAMTGRYSVSRVGFSGDPDAGEIMTVTCRAADFVERMKATGSRHYDEKNGFGTAGQIFRALAAEAGVPAAVAAEIDGIEIPYRLRWNQTAIDFASDLADEIGAIVKPQAGRLVILARGSGASASGKELPEILVRHDPSYSWEVDLEERSSVERTETAWFDPKTGRTRSERAATGRTGGPSAGMHPQASRGDARKAAAARAQELSRYTGTGSFEGPGRPEAVAGAPVTVTGFGQTIDAIAWEASGVTHEIEPEGGWITTIEVQTKEKAR
jgi:hypothetical protein